ncbi:MAG: cyclase family protein [Pseudomonadota bacterium]
MTQSKKIHPIARILDFDGDQPSYFGVAPADAQPMRAGGFIGDTREGGSCNASVLSMNPHCHGTHTECIGHVVDKRVHAIDMIPNQPLDALLVSLGTTSARRCKESLPVSAAPPDRILTLASLQSAIGRKRIPEALVVRTRPNPTSKRTQHYLDSSDYPFFSVDAVQWIVQRGVKHLLLDTPSLDRLDDGGRLELHRIFWNLPRDTRQLTRDARTDATITEMIYAANTIEDGRYKLALQPAPFKGDATPSNPILFR